jgi:predicted DNA-binding protein with PD1-like motif
MITQTAEIRRLVYARLNPGDDVLLSLRQVVQEHNIRHGAILSVIGSLTHYHVHVVKTTNLPPGDVFWKDEGPFDILTLTGYILDGRVHAHITFSNTEKAMGGHLEEGCRVLTFAVVLIAETTKVDMTNWDSVGAL